MTEPIAPVPGPSPAPGPIRAYKAFNSKFQCNPTGGKPFQYEVGQTYRLAPEDGAAVLCQRGFHACLRPTDVFNYYAPAGARFAEVELGGVVSHGEDKSCATEIKIVRELSLGELITAQIGMTTEAATPEGPTASGAYGAATASGAYGAATASGTYGAATASGTYGAATASGDRGAATASGTYGAATASGDRGAASGAVGCVLFLLERDLGTGKILAHTSVMVDGVSVKAGVFYTLKDGVLAPQDGEA